MWGQRVEGAVEVIDAVTQFVAQPLGRRSQSAGPGMWPSGSSARAVRISAMDRPTRWQARIMATQHVTVVAALVAGGAVPGKLGTEVLWSDLAGDGARLGVIGRARPWRR